LTALADLGVVMFMFAVGYLLDLHLIRGRERVAASVSVGSIILPLSLGVGLGVWLASRHHVHKVLPFALFVGTAMSGDPRSPGTGQRPDAAAAFAESAEPEDVWEILGEYNGALGDLIGRFEGTLERFTGDGIVVFFNDPIPCDDAPLRSVRMALTMRQRVQELADGWQRRGHELALGVGIAQGYATLGRVGYADRFEYASVGSVTNLAARLCAEAAPWQILVTQRVNAAAEEVVLSRLVGELSLRGFSRPIRTFEVSGLDSAKVTS
jgi:class 3 adenylate cyclase